MFCRNCGAQLPDNVSFCPNCGTAVPKSAAAAAVSDAKPETESQQPQAAPEQPKAVPSQPQGQYNQTSGQVPPNQGRYTQAPGSVPPQYGQAPAAEQDPADGMALGSVIAGVLGLIGSWIPFVRYFTLVCSIVAILLGAIARKKEKALNLPTGKATAGLVLGIIGVVLTVLVIVACVACAAWLTAVGETDVSGILGDLDQFTY